MVAVRTLGVMPGEVIQGFGQLGDDEPQEQQPADEAPAEQQVWQPLSVREGRAEPDLPFEGVPAHLTRTLSEWLDSTIKPPYPTGDSLTKVLSLRLRIPTELNYPRIHSILEACDSDDDVFLDAVDYALNITDGHTAGDLQAILTLGGSVWEVNGTADGLARRVSKAEQAAYGAATRPIDDATTNLRSAWRNVYGRHPNPSAAWGDAIKAVENVLGPIVTPKDNVGTLGKIIPALRDGAKKFSFRLSSSSKTGSVETLSQVLQLMYPNPDVMALATAGSHRWRKLRMSSSWPC